MSKLSVTTPNELLFDHAYDDRPTFPMGLVPDSGKTYNDHRMIEQLRELSIVDGMELLIELQDGDYELVDDLGTAAA